MFFKQLGLKTELTDVVAGLGYAKPTPIQTKAIPVILGGADVLACAQTGTGKTAAFTLPLLQLLSREPAAHSRCPGRSPRALVLVPTRELAAQVEKSVLTYGQGLPLRTTVVFGGVNIKPQLKQLERGVDIMVATPGRLLDHALHYTLDLSRIEILVLDEADRMLDMGFIHDIRRILKLLPQKRQNLLFSATFPDAVKDLAESMLHKPACLEVARRNSAVETVTQVVHPVEKQHKRRLLSHLIRQGHLTRILVFIKTKHAANRLARQLQEDGINATAIHGNKSQGARTRALADFKNGEVNVLVATDIASRGLDIKQIPQVVNFDLPDVPEDYIHRIGRTGRAGEAGLAISLVSPDERDLLKAIQKLLSRDIKVEVVTGFDKDALPAAAPGTAKPTSEPGGRVKREHVISHRERPAGRKPGRNGHSNSSSNGSRTSSSNSSSNGSGNSGRSSSSNGSRNSNRNSSGNSSRSSSSNGSRNSSRSSHNNSSRNNHSNSNKRAAGW